VVVVTMSRRFGAAEFIFVAVFVGGFATTAFVFVVGGVAIAVATVAAGGAVGFVFRHGV
jgi:hypothetical protein